MPFPLLVQISIPIVTAWYVVCIFLNKIAITIWYFFYVNRNFKTSCIHLIHLNVLLNEVLASLLTNINSHYDNLYLLGTHYFPSMY